jgi:hypothetical protein
LSDGGRSERSTDRSLAVRKRAGEDASLDFCDLEPPTGLSSNLMEFTSSIKTGVNPDLTNHQGLQETEGKTPTPKLSITSEFTRTTDPALWPALVSLSRIGQGPPAAPRYSGRHQPGANCRLVGRKDTDEDPALPLYRPPACHGLKNKGMEFATSVRVTSRQP